MKQTIRFKMAKLHPGQLEILKNILNDKAMYHTICTSRQYGKSFLAVQLLLYFALTFPNSQIMFSSPVFSQANKVFKELIKGIQGAGIIDKTNNKENSIILCNGSELYFKSVNKPDNLRGYSIDYMICDEAAMYKDTTFDAILRPMLTVRGKKCIFLSTPKGRNWFYKMYMNENNSDRYKSYKANWRKNPYANIEEIEDAKKRIPESLFRQEYEGEFVDDMGGVFNNYNKCSIIDHWEQPQSNKRYYCGLDLARQKDFTVLTIIDEKGRVVFMYRKNKSDWNVIIKDIIDILKKWKPKKTNIEINNIGDVTFDLVKRQYNNITPFLTNNETKQQYIENLIYAFEGSEIAIPTEKLFEELHNEIKDFGVSFSPKTKKVVYAAISGHDDCVISLALAYDAYKSGPTSSTSVYIL